MEGLFSIWKKNTASIYTMQENILPGYEHFQRLTNFSSLVRSGIIMKTAMFSNTRHDSLCK